MDRSSQSIEYQTGLTHREHITAGRILRERGLPVERSNRLEYGVYFQVNFGALREAWQAAMGEMRAKG